MLSSADSNEKFGISLLDRVTKERIHSFTHFRHREGVAEEEEDTAELLVLFPARVNKFVKKNFIHRTIVSLRAAR